jgi:hypothetical protein
MPAKHGRKKKGVQPVPEIFVQVPAGTSGRIFQRAAIRTRRGVYRYLVWREGEKKRELYLGKVKHIALQRHRDRTELAAGGELRLARFTWGKKSRLKGGRK